MGSFAMPDPPLAGLLAVVCGLRELCAGRERLGAGSRRAAAGASVAGGDSRRGIAVCAPGAGERGRGVTDRAAPEAARRPLGTGRPIDLGLCLRALRTSSPGPSAGSDCCRR